MSVDESLGSATGRKSIRESSYGITIGFPTDGSSTYKKNMFVTLNTSGQVVPVAATSGRAFGRVVSAYEGNDTGNVRVAVPFESHIGVYSDGGIDEGQFLACSGFDATSGLPKLKVAVGGDTVVAICIKSAADTVTTGEVGVLLVPFLFGVTGISALTDNSGGATADGTIGAIPAATAATTDTSAASLTSTNTAITALKDAVKELSTKVNAIIAATA